MLLARALDVGVGDSGWRRRGTQHAAGKKEHGDSLGFMRGIKGLADPNGIMNPGKVFATGEEIRRVPEESY